MLSKKMPLKRRKQPLLLLVSLIFCVILSASSQYQQQDDGYGYGDNYQGDYTDVYGQDTMFQDYEEGKLRKGDGIGLPVALTSLVGWIVGAKFHVGRAVSKLKRQHHKAQKELYKQYYDDVYKLQATNAEMVEKVNKLQQSVWELEERIRMEELQREYDEFKQPDLDGDDRISRAEFNMYINNYLKNYPGMKPEDFPKWEEFDKDGSGYITFEEYTEQMARQLQNEQKKNASSRSNDHKLAGITNLYKETKYADDFEDLFDNLFG